MERERKYSERKSGGKRGETGEEGEGNACAHSLNKAVLVYPMIGQFRHCLSTRGQTRNATWQRLAIHHRVTHTSSTLKDFPNIDSVRSEQKVCLLN